MSVPATRAVLYHSRARGAAFRTLLVFADFADQDGIAFPSARTVAKLTRANLRNTRNIIKALVAAGELVPLGERSGGVKVYQLAVCSAADAEGVSEMTPLSETTGVENDTPEDDKGCRKRQGGSVDIDRGGVSISTPEPPLEPPLEPRIAAAAAEQAVSEFNALADELRLVRVQRLTARRRNLLAARLAERGGLPGWGHVLSRIRDGPGLCGDNERGWRLDFDWLISDETHLARVAEGQYDGWTGNPTNGSGRRRETAADRMLAGFAAAADRAARRQR